VKSLRLVSEGILYRNPKPGYKAECAYLPNIVPLSHQELLCFYRIGQAFYSADGRLALLRSTDGGETWSPDGLVWDSKEDTAPYSYTAPHATRLRDGTLLLVATRKDISDPERPDFNPDTGELWNRQSVLFRSTDDGHTWSAPQVLDLPGGEQTDTPSQIIELNDGRWFLPCERWQRDPQANALHIKGFAIFSDDGGKTWGNRVDYPSAADRQKMYSHSRYTRLLDGRIAALQWTQEIGTNKNLELHLVTSDVTGAQWSVPHPTGILGQTSWLADLGEGVLVAAYSRRDCMDPGIKVVLSEDGGRTWDLDNPVVVWDAVGQEYLGVAHKPSYPASHDNIAFGKPNAARLPDGQVIVSWWCTQACVTHTRFARLEVR